VSDAVCQRLPPRTPEHRRVLLDQGDVPAQFVQAPFSDRPTLNAYLSPLWLAETDEQLQQCRLAGAGRPDDGGDSATGNVHGDVTQDLDVAPDTPDIVEFDSRRGCRGPDRGIRAFAAYLCRWRALLGDGLQPDQPLERGTTCVERGDRLRDLHHRVRQLHCVEQEADERSDGQRALLNACRAHGNDDEERRLYGERRRHRRDGLPPTEPDPCAVGRIDRRGEPSSLDVFGDRCLHSRERADESIELVGEVADSGALCTRAALDPRENHEQCTRRNGHDEQRDSEEEGIDGRHEDKGSDNADQAHSQLNQRLRRHGPYERGIGRHPGDHIARCLLAYSVESCAQ
jgi:hypothetical protein